MNITSLRGIIFTDSGVDFAAVSRPEDVQLQKQLLTDFLAEKPRYRPDQQILSILKRTGAIISDSHIIYTSGKHGSVYINPDNLLPYPQECAAVGRLFAERFVQADIDVVIAPAIGGIILSTWTAYYLSKLKHRDIFGLFTEKTPDKNQILERGFEKLLVGKRVLVIEDVTTTGGSVKKVVDSARNAGGDIVAVCVMVNRDPEQITSLTIGAPFSALGIVRAEAFAESECPLCQRNVPINTEVGHGKEYLAKKSKR